MLSLLICILISTFRQIIDSEPKLLNEQQMRSAVTEQALNKKHRTGSFRSVQILLNRNVAFDLCEVASSRSEWIWGDSIEGLDPWSYSNNFYAYRVQ